MSEVYDIGPLRLDAEACVLTHDGAPLPLGKRAVATLAVLVRAAPDFVGKSRILEAAWPGRIVEEGNLAVQILAIRRALAPFAGAEGWLETLARRGYRFVGPVVRVAAQATEAVTPDARPTLPEPLTSFVGRERELAELAALLAGHRLLTLTGAGGVGKTRLALQLATRVSSGYRDGVCLVELADLRDPALVPQATISALGLQEQPGRTLTQTIADHLGARHLLLLVDNAEHLLAACAQLAGAVLPRCPRVTLLVTSRERLDVPGEMTYRVPSLSVPAAPAAGAEPATEGFESMRLFAERARLHRPHFALDDGNARAVASICRHLDGIALAIELAAARVRSMAVEDIEQRLDGRFALLTGGSRILAPRQQTLRAAIDWSFDLLAEPEKTLFCAISVFAGGFTLDAAERVCAGEALPAHDIMDVLAALADKSLVVVDEREGGTRYRLLETMRAYAAERARTLFSEPAWPARHLAYFCAMAEAAEPELKGSDQRAWLERLDTEHDNVRAALAESAVIPEGVETGLVLASAFARFWLVRGHLAEGRGWLSRLLEASAGSAGATRAKALNWAGIFAWKQGDYAAARDFYEQSLAIRRELGDRKGVGAVLNNQGLLAYEQCDYRTARRLHEDSLAVDRELGDRWGVGVSLIHLAGLAMMQGDAAAARALNEESLAIFRELGDRGHMAHALRALGHVCTQEGGHDAARALFDESLAICRDLGDRSGIAGALHGLGVTARNSGDVGAARPLLEESLAIYRALGDREGTAKALSQLGHVAAARGDPEAALRSQRESLAIYRRLNDRWGIAHAIEGLACANAARGESGRAATLWGAAERLREEIAAPRTPSERLHDDRAVARARTASDADAFDAAWREGRAMSVEHAIDLALQEGGSRDRR